jgi:peptidoglycan/LPS O-acetylase OafA/YrhL
LHSNQFSPKTTHYYPGIDSLRAIAVLLVLFHHYFNQKFARYFALGNFGVDVFFTISGFLITGILFSYKEKLTFAKALKVFYIRRILRIFPIYYLYIGVVIILFHKEISHQLILWTALFAENFYLISGGKMEWVLVHFWSLAVEEQFYLVWPFLIFIVNRKYSKIFITIIIISSFIFSVLYTLFFKVPYVDFMHPLSCFLALAMGALVSYMNRYEKENLNFFARNSLSFFIGSLLLWMLVLAFYDFGFHALFILLRLFASLATAFFIIRIIVKHESNWIDNIIHLPWLQYIGRISYGIYVYHLIVKILLDPLLSKWVNSLTSEKNLLRNNLYVITLPLYTIITIGIASLSFTFFESKINKLKNRIGNRS